MRIPHSGATQPLGLRWGFETTSKQVLARASNRLDQLADELAHIIDFKFLLSQFGIR
jgi:hypothetical protein